MEARAQDESVGDGPSDGANSVPIYLEELAIDITGTQTSIMLKFNDIQVATELVTLFSKSFSFSLWRISYVINHYLDWCGHISGMEGGGGTSIIQQLPCITTLKIQTVPDI